MHRIDSANNAAVLPAPIAGVNPPGFFNNNPGAGPGTVVSGDWANAVQEELTGVVEGLGLALDKNDNGQLLKAILQAVRGGQCQLRYSSAVQLLLMPLDGAFIRLNGKVRLIPDAGVAIANTNVEIGGVAAQNLAANTDYLLYIKDNGAGGLVPSFWPLAGGHVADTTAGNKGVEVRNNGGVPDSTRSLVGLVGTNGAAQFSSMLTRSWFNRPSQKATAAASGSTASNSSVEIGTGFRIPFVCWADDFVVLSAAGYSSISNTSETDCSVGLDGAALNPDQKANLNGVQFVGVPFASIVTGPRTEGRHTASLFGWAGAGGTATFYGQAEVALGR